MELRITEESPLTAEARALMDALDADLATRYPPENIHRAAPEELARDRAVFLVARLDGAPVGCGALRPLDTDKIELKRMYVRPEARGQGVARAILATLERLASARGFQTIRLETGDLQPEAIGLYASAGYRSVPCFGEYAADPLSRCMEKTL